MSFGHGSSPALLPIVRSPAECIVGEHFDAIPHRFSDGEDQAVIHRVDIAAVPVHDARPGIQTRAE